jgi:predicted phosphodiesterase
MTFRTRIISDTHGLLTPEAERRLAGVDHIIHGGDIGCPEIIDALRRIAPAVPRHPPCEPRVRLARRGTNPKVANLVRFEFMNGSSDRVARPSRLSASNEPDFGRSLLQASPRRSRSST